MTHGVIRERLGFTRAEWGALPWHEARSYLEYLQETADRAAGRDPDRQQPGDPTAPPRVEEPASPDMPGPVAPPVDYDPADDADEPLGPPEMPVLTFDDVPAAPPPDRADRPAWLPALPIRQVTAFGPDTG